jgi:hypothetical protein
MVCGEGGLRKPISISMFNLIAKQILSMKHEREKSGKYEQLIIEIEHLSFVFFSTVGMSILISNFYKLLAKKLCENNQLPLSTSISLIRCHLSFVILFFSIVVTIFIIQDLIEHVIIHR